jgi:hypothetical protein
VAGESVLSAVFRLPDLTPDVRAEYARSDIPEVRAAAVEHISDQRLLVEIINSDAWAEVRKIAIGNLTDQGLLFHLAQKPEMDGILDYRTRANWHGSSHIDAWIILTKAAIKKIKDPSMLSRLFSYRKAPEIQMAIIETSTDASFLERIALEEKDWQIRRLAVEKIGNQAILARIATKDKDPYVRQVAVMKLDDTSVLDAIVREDRHSIVKEEARRRLVMLK